MDNIIELRNHFPLEDFSGLSPEQMHYLLYESENQIISILNSVEANHEIPILKLIYSLIDKIDFEKGIKLTQAGYLPVKIIKDIYSEKIIIDDAIERGITKLSKEFDSEAIHYARIIGTLSGYLRNSNSKLFVTKRGKSFLENKDNLSRVFNIFGTKFNLGYLDGYENESIAQVGFRFSLYLLLKYGSSARDKRFYAEKYFTAFPNIGEKEDSNFSCYNIRTFERFFRYFGIIELKGKRREEKVYCTELLNKYFRVEL